MACRPFGAASPPSEKHAEIQQELGHRVRRSFRTYPTMRGRIDSIRKCHAASTPPPRPASNHSHTQKLFILPLTTPPLVDLKKKKTHQTGTSLQPHVTQPRVTRTSQKLVASVSPYWRLRARRVDKKKKIMIFFWIFELVSSTYNLLSLVFGF